MQNLRIPVIAILQGHNLNTAVRRHCTYWYEI